MPTPPRLKASDFDPEVLKLFDQYVHGVIDRRGFLGKAASLVGTVGAVTLLSALSPQFALAQQVKPDDKRLHTESVEFASPKGYGKARGYLAKPAKAKGLLPLVVVVHENRGLNPHIEDVARRFALAGYLAFAPDALFPLGGYPGDEDKARVVFKELDQAKTEEDFVAACELLLARKDGNGRLGVVGFCYGGHMAATLATRLPQVLASVPFYGLAPAVEDVPRIKAEVLLVLAAEDERVNGSWPPCEAAMKAAGVTYEVFQPPATQHGFHNDTTPRYDEAGAKEAWKRTLALFDRHLRVTA